jgi:uncharacterized protein YjbJ (UPF0337 family)
VHGTPEHTHRTMNATTLVMDGGDAGMHIGFELRVARGARSEGRSRTTSQEVQHMSIDDQAKGKLEEAKGRGEQAQGDLTGDNKKKGEGVVDEAKGKARQAADRVKEAAHDITK